MKKRNQFKNEVIDNWHTIPGDICLKSAQKQGAGNVDNYQNIELAEAMSHCRHWRNAIDVGAHVGIVSYQLSRSFEHVYSFEINTNLIPCLELNLKNRDVKNCTIFPYGAGARDEFVDLKITNKTFGTHVVPMSGGTGKFQTKPLDDFEFEKIDFVKIDAEGYEPFVALGGMELLKKWRPIILYERKAHPRRYGYFEDSLVEILRPLGYDILKRVGKGHKNAIAGVKHGV